MYEHDNPTRQKEPSQMAKRIAPSAFKAQELPALLQGDTEGHSGEEGLRT